MVRFSLIIISYKRDDALVENLQALLTTAGERDDLEIVLVDNNEDDKDRAAFLQGFMHPIYYKPGTNRGVTGGRNDGIARASGGILVFLDDDAFISPADFPERIEEVFRSEPKSGIIAFRSTNFYTRQMDPAEFPHTDKGQDPNSAFKTFRYIGVGHAVRREVFEATGIYDDDFFYAMEEFDLSFRAIKAGYEIVYSPEIAVLHKKNAAGRMPAVRVVEKTLLNKLRVNFKHLPLRYHIVSSLLWIGRALWLTRGRASVINVYRTYRAWACANRGLRQPLSGSALAYVRLCNGQLWK